MDLQMSREKGRAGGFSLRTLSGLGLAGAVMVMTLALTGCGGSSSGDDGPVRSTMNPVTMETKYTMDGRVDFSTFATVNSQAVTINDNLGTGAAVRTIELRWAMDNDDRDLYIAMEWSDPTWNNTYIVGSGSTDYDGIRVLFDVDGDGTLDADEDKRMLVAASVGSVYSDQHNVESGADLDLIGDGFGKLRYDAATQTYQAELLFPMRQDANGQDGALTSASKINFVLYDHVTALSGNIGYVFGSTNSSAAWPSLSLNSEVGFSHPRIPDGLTGLAVFISEHDAQAGEIYSMDLASGTITRVTTKTDLYKDKLALSHDRTRITFEGVSCDLDLETIEECRQRSGDYEIYRVDVDGGNLTRLTSNLTRDGHPAWSPDDQSLVYTSYRNGSNGAVVIMDADGAETVNDLSGVADDDRDPDFLPDGRIVFATNRFTSGYQSRIAVMSDAAAGSDAMKLTDSAGVSDYAPVADASKVIFERFSKDSDPATDVESLFVPWDLVETQLAGGAETTLLSDGWVNRQPVIDPSGRYLAYLKNNGYSAAYLMGLDGAPYGRFIPDLTTVRSLDWK